MIELTAGNWIAYQSESQKQRTTDEQWTIAIEHQYPTCHGVGPDGAYLRFSGICTEADAKAMAASKELLEACQAFERGQSDAPLLIRAAIVKAGQP